MQDTDGSSDFPDGLGSLAHVLETLHLVDIPPEQAYGSFIRVVVHHLRVDRALVSIVHEGAHDAVFRRPPLLGPPAGVRAESPDAPMSRMLAREVALADKPVLLADAAADSQVCARCDLKHTEGGAACGRCDFANRDTQAFLGVPIHGPGHVPIGALAAIHTAPRHWSDEDVSFMTDLARCVSDQIKLRAALLRTS